MKNQESSFFDRLGRAWTARKDAPTEIAAATTSPRKQYAQLESRVLFDGAAAVAAERQLDDGGQHPAATDEHGTQDKSIQERSHAIDTAATAGAQPGPTVVVIDARVQDYQQLLQGIDPAATVRIVGENEDGLQVVSALLGSTGNVASLQIVSHGSAGMVRLGSTVLDNAALEKDGVAASLQGWRAGMAPDGDILLLGCDVAAGVKGQSFVQKLADLTQADISASLDDTGAAPRGGNWVLEFSTGSAGTRLAFSDMALNSYSDLLADPADRAQTTLNLPADVMLGSSGAGSVTFDNNGLGNGYAPYVAIAFKGTGTDGVNNGNEGVTYRAGSARFLGAPVVERVLTFSGGQAVLTGLDNNGGAGDIVFTLAQFAGMQNGDQLVVFQLPFGSFTPAQTAATVTFSFDVGRNADVAPGLAIVSRGVYRLGQTPTNDAGDPVVLGDAATATLTPRVYSSSYNIITREDEQVAGPNDTQTISYDVRIANGQGASGFRAEMDIPDNIVVSLTDPALMPHLTWEGAEPPGVVYKIVDASTPLASVTAATPNLLPQANGTYANAKIVAIAPAGTNIADGAGSDTYSLAVRYYVPRTDAAGANDQAAPGYVIDRDTGADTTGSFDARSRFTWLPADPDGNEGTTSITDDTLAARVLDWEPIVIQKTVSGTTPNQLDDPTVNNDPLLGLSTNPALGNVAGAGAGDPEGVRSGDLLTYNLNFQVSDYHGVRNVVITDILADGLDLFQADGTTFVGLPKLTFTANGQTLSLANIDPANITVTNLADGRQQLVIRLSDELVARAFGNVAGAGVQQGDLIGAAFADAAAGGLTAGSISYQVRVLDQYRSAANGNPASGTKVNENDVFNTSVQITGTVLNNTGSLATPGVVDTGFATVDDSGTTSSIKDGNLVLEIYAVNGVLAADVPKDANGNVILAPGDNVSYRIRYQTTQGDFTQLKLTAYLPDPFFRPDDANADGVADGAAAGGAPGTTSSGAANSNFVRATDTVGGASGPTANWAQAGTFVLGPSATDPGHQHPDTIAAYNANQIGITTTASDVGNSIQFSFANANQTANPGGGTNTQDIGQSREVDLIFTVRLTDQAYAASLQTTAQANETSERSPNSGVTTATPIQDNRLIQIALAAPQMEMSHGVIGTVSGQGGTIAGTTLPGGASAPSVGGTLPTAATASIAGLSAANAITGTGQLNGNVTNVDAGDTLRMAATLVNSGNGEAFRVETGAIAPPPGYRLAGGGTDLANGATNLRVMRGDGSVLVQGVDWAFTDGTHTAIRMIDRNWAGNDAVDGGQVDGQLLSALNDDGTTRTDGRNVLVITYDVVANDGTLAQATAADNSTSGFSLASYFGSNTSSSDYLPGPAALSDAATLLVAQPAADIRWQGDATTGDKTVTADDSNQGHTSGQNLVIGEKGYFDVKITVPEGMTGNLAADIVLPPGLKLDTSYNGGIGYEIIMAAAGTGANSAGLNGQLAADFAGSGVSAASLLNIAGVGGTLGDSGVDARISLGTITAAADNDGSNNSFIIRVRVTVDNVTGNQQGTNLTTSATARYTDLDGPTGSEGPTTVAVADATSANNPTITVVEPTVTTVTTVAVVDIDPNTGGDQPGTQVDENGVVEYTITLTNTSAVKAWDLSLDDVLPPELRNDASLQITSITSGGASRNGAGAALGAADLALNTAARTLTLNGANSYDLDAGGTIVIKVRGTVNQSAAGEASFSNTAQTRWTSLDRSAVDGNDNGTGERGGADALLNGTLVVNAGAGASSGVGANQASTTSGLDNYRTASSTSVPVLALQPALSRIGGLVDTSPSADNNPGNDTAAGSPTTGTAQSVAVGEIVRFRMVTRVPQGLVADLALAPNLPPGYSFLDDGTAVVALVSDSGMTASALGLGAQLGDADPALYASIQNFLNSANFAGVDPRAAGSAPMLAIINSGTAGAPRFALGDVHNVDSDTDFEYVVIEFNVVVANQSSNQAGHALDTSFTVSSGATVLGTSNITRDVVVEPDIPVDKHVVDVQPQSPQGGTNVITTELSYTASAGPNTATAYEVVLTDSYPSGSNYTLGVLTVGGTSYDLSTVGGQAAAATAGITFSATAGGISISVPRVDPGTTVTLRYDSTVPTGVSQPADAASSAHVTYSSLPDSEGWAAGAARFGGSAVGTDGTAGGERTGADGLPANPSNPADTAAPLNNYQAADPAGFGTISGTLWDDTHAADGVIAAGEAPLADVTVTLTWAGVDGAFGTADDRVITTVTDAAGQYGFGALPGDDPATAGINEGRYRISVPTGIAVTDAGDGADADLLTMRFDRTDGATLGLDVAELTLGDGAAAATRDFGYLQPNDAPQNLIGGSATFPATPIAVTEDVTFAFTGGNQLSIADPDGGQGDGLLSTTLTATNGTLALVPGTATITAGASGSNTITLQGTQAQINAALATLSFTGTNNFSGAATLTITTNDRGQGGNAGGDPLLPREAGGTASPDALSDTDVITLDVLPVSDAPRLTVGTPPGQNTSPPAPGTGGGNDPTQTVTGTALGVEDTTIPLGLVVTSADPSSPETITSVTISGVPAGWVLVGGGTNITSTGTGITYNIPTADLPLLGIRPPVDVHGAPAPVLTVTATAQDGAAATATTTGTLTVDVRPVNDRPVVNDATAIDLGTIAEGTAASNAQTVGTLFGPRYSDPKDTGEPNGADAMIGVFVTGSAANAVTEGSWQYSTDGGTTWVDIPASTSDATAIYLDNASQIRFTPVDSNYSGTPGQLTVRLVENDQAAAAADVPNGAAAGTTIGTALDTTPGSTSDISAPVAAATQFATGRVSEALQVGIVVTPVSDAPVLTIGTGTQEPGNPPGTTGTESSPPAPATGNNGTASVTGSVRGIEDQPIPLDITVTVADSSNAETVTTVVISGVPSGWVLRDGTNTIIPTVAGSTAGLTTAQLAGLTITAPSDLNSTGPVGTTPAATLTITVSSSDGVAPAATTTGTLHVAVTPVNDRPVVNDLTAIDLGTIDEGTSNSTAQTVGTLFGPRFSDPKDTGESNGADAMIGVFITGSAADAATEGSWQYSIDGGATWLNIPASTNDASAIYLDNTSQIRFAPVDSNYSGTPGQLTVRLVENDQAAAAADVPNGAAAGTTIGTPLNTTPGSTSDISAPVAAATQFATGRVSEALQVGIVVTPVSDAPVLTIGTGTQEPGNPPDTTGEESSPPAPTTGNNGTATVTGSVRGVEDQPIPIDITVAVADASNAETVTTVVISNVPAGWVLRDGTNTVIPTTAGSTAGLTPAQLAGLTITAPSDVNSTGLVGTTPAATLTITVSSSDGVAPAATTTGTLHVAVTPVNDRPVVNDLTAIDLGTIDEGTPNSTAQTVGTLFGPRFSDPKDTGEPNGADNMIGVFVTGSAANAATEGSWQYSTDGGTIWLNIPASTNDASAIYLDNTSQIRFAPVDSNYSGTPGQLTVRLVENDQAAAAADVPNGAAAGTTIGTPLNTVPGSVSDISAPAANATQFATGRVSEALQVGIVVAPVSDAPVLTIGTGTQEAGNPPGTTGEESSPQAPATGNNGTASVTGSVRGIEDQPIPLDITVTVADTSNAETVTTVVISGVPAGWVLRDGTNTVIPTVAGSTAGLTTAQLAGLTITAPSDLNSIGPVGTTPAATLTITVSSSDGAAPAATTTGTLHVAVTPVNDRPVVNDLTAIDLGTIDEGTPNSAAQTVGTLFGPRFTDPKDTGESNGTDSMIGVFVTGSAANAVTEGSWQYSTDGGATWVNIPASTTDASAIYLDNTSQIRFAPVDSNYSGTPGQLTVRLVENDQAAAAADVPNGAAAGTTIGTPLNTTPGSTSDISAPVAAATQFATGRVSEALQVGIVVAPVSDAPILTIGTGTQEAGNPPGTTGEESSPPAPATGNDGTATVTGSVRGVEDQPIPVDITVTVADSSNAETVTTVVISGVPAGWVLRDGTNTIIPTVAGSTAGLTTAQLAGLTITAPSDVNSVGPVGTTPAATLTITVSSSDGAATAATTTGTLHVAVTPVNDRPVVNDPTAIDLGTIDEGTPSSTAQTVGTLFGPRFSDPKDTGEPNGADAMIGVFVTGSAADAATEGSWQYSIDGGATWLNIPAATSEATAIYLDNTSQIRFAPVDSNYSGTPGQLTVRLVENDQAAAAADVPNGAAAGTTIGTALDTTPGGTSDITAPAANATQFATGRVSEALQVGIVVAPVSDAPVLTIGTGTQEAGNPPGTTGQESSPPAPVTGNDATATVTGSVRGVEDQPIPIDIAVTVADSSNAETVTTVVISDIPAGWVLRDGTNTVIPTVAGSTAGLTSAQLAGLTITAPSDLNSIGLVGTTPAATLTITVSSSDGVAPAATTTGTLHVAVTPVNDRPVVNDPTAIDLGTIDEGTPNSTAQTVGTLFGPRFSDPKDTGEPNGADSMIGVFVTGSAADAATEGSWQYSTDGGATWVNIPASTSDASAIYLDNTSQIRFAPVDSNYSGTPGQLTVRLVENDQAAAAADVPNGAAAGTTIGTALNTTPGSVSDISAPVATVAEFGTGRVSEALQVGIVVAPVSDAPVLTIGTGPQEAGNPPGTTGEESSPPAPATGNDATATVTGSVRGVEDQPIPLDIAVTAADSSNPEAVTTVVISGVPSGWVLRDGTNTIIPTVAGSTAGLTTAQLAGLTITAPSDLNSIGPVGTTPAATLTITVSSSDGVAPAATTTGTLHVAVTPVNDRPVVNDPTAIDLGAIDEGTPNSAAQTVGTLFGPRYSDPKDTGETNGADSMIGVFVTASAANAVTEGSWQYSTDGGATWVNIPASTSDASAIYLDNTSQIRFAPVDSNYSGTPGQLTVRLVENDQAAAGAIVPDVPNGAAAGTTIGTPLDTTPGSTSDISGPAGTAAQFATGRVSETLRVGIMVEPLSDAPILTIGNGPQEPGNPPGTTGQQSSPPAPPAGNNPTATVTGSVRGMEDQPIALPITVVPADTSAPETTVTVVVSNVPQGWVLRDGNGDVIPTNGGTTASLTPAQLAGLTITAPSDLNSIGLVGASQAATLTITATSRDAGAADAVTTGTLNIAVTPVNDRPVVNGPIAPDYQPLLPGETTAGRTIEDLFGPRFTDPRDAPEPNGADVFAGVAVIRTPPASQGIYQYSLDGGATWVSIAPDTTPAQAVVLTPDARLRFVSNAAFIGDTQPLQAVLVETDRSGAAADLPGRPVVPGDAPGSSAWTAGTIVDLSGLEANEALAPGGGSSRVSILSAPMEVGVRVDPPFTAQPDLAGPYLPQEPLLPVTVNPVLHQEPAEFVGNAVEASQALAALEDAQATALFESNLGNSGLLPNWIAPEGIPGLDPFAAPLPQPEAKPVAPAAAVPVAPRADAHPDIGCARPRVVAKPRPPGAPRPAPRFPPGSEAARRFSEQLKRARARTRC